MISELNQSVRPWWASDPQRNHWDRELFGELPNEAAENPKPFRPIATAECILCNRLLEIDHSLWLRKSSRNQPKEAIRKSPPDAARMPCALVSRREALGEQRCESVGVRLKWSQKMKFWEWWLHHRTASMSRRSSGFGPSRVHLQRSEH